MEQESDEELHIEEIENLLKKIKEADQKYEIQIEKLNKKEIYLEEQLKKANEIIKDLRQVKTNLEKKNVTATL